MKSKQMKRIDELIEQLRSEYAACCDKIAIEAYDMMYDHPEMSSEDSALPNVYHSPWVVEGRLSSLIPVLSERFDGDIAIAMYADVVAAIKRICRCGS